MIHPSHHWANIQKTWVHCIRDSCTSMFPYPCWEITFIQDSLEYLWRTDVFLIHMFPLLFLPHFIIYCSPDWKWLLLELDIFFPWQHCSGAGDFKCIYSHDQKCGKSPWSQESWDLVSKWSMHLETCKCKVQIGKQLRGQWEVWMLTNQWRFTNSICEDWQEEASNTGSLNNVHWTLRMWCD